VNVFSNFDYYPINGDEDSKELIESRRLIRGSLRIPINCCGLACRMFEVHLNIVYYSDCIVLMKC